MLSIYFLSLPGFDLGELYGWGINTIDVFHSSPLVSVGLPDMDSQDAKEASLSLNTWSAPLSCHLSFELKPYSDLSMYYIINVFFKIIYFLRQGLTYDRLALD